MHTFFLSANSGNGFYNLYDHVFDTECFDKIFVIFGGPGTGKSTIMRRMSQKAQEKGATAEEFICSSDFHSLDGIILAYKGKKIGILDGTPPHARTVTKPAIKEELWDISRFWDTKRIEQQQSEIHSASFIKKCGYRTAYAYLAAAGTIHEEGIARAKERFLREKAEKQIKRRIPTITANGERKTRFVRCYAMQGVHTVANWTDKCESIVSLKGNEYSAELYLQEFSKELQKEGREYLLIRSPLCPERADALFFPGTGTLLCKEALLTDADKSKIRALHLSRFEKNDAPKEIKRVLKAEAFLIERACEALETVSKGHFSLEKYFSAAMDFDAMRKQTEIWEKRAFEILGI